MDPARWGCDRDGVFGLLIWGIGATSAAGTIRVALVDGRGEGIPGFSVEDSLEIFGNEIERTVEWKGGAGVGALSGRPVRV